MTATAIQGLRHVIVCHIPAPAFDRLRAGETPLMETAIVALEAGLAQPLPDVAPNGWLRLPRRPLAVSIPHQLHKSVVLLAQQAFDGDHHNAAGWLLARGLGMLFPLPTESEMADIQEKHQQTAVQQATPPPPPTSTPYIPPRRRPESPRQPLPPDDSAPYGKELAQRRAALGISQRDLAEATGLSRGLIASIELGHRRHVLTRLRMAETLASLERDKRDKKEK